MINNIVSGIKNTTKFFFSIFIRFPDQLVRIQNELKMLSYKLRNIAKSNIELGVYHLHKGNISDSIFRLKLVDKYLEPGNKLANYWLGWAYLLKQDYHNAIKCLEKSEGVDKVNLLAFIKSLDSIENIPSNIITIQRDISAQRFINKFINNQVNIPEFIVIELNKVIKDLPYKYKVLELGSNVGLLGYEIRKRMQDSLTLTGVENSLRMIELQTIFFQEQNLYDQIFNISIESYLKSPEQSYDIVFSINGLSYTKTIEKVIRDIYVLLNKNGYFVFTVPTSNQSGFSKKLLEFYYSTTEISHVLEKIGFKILFSKEFNLEITNTCTIFVCTK